MSNIMLPLVFICGANFLSHILDVVLLPHCSPLKSSLYPGCASPTFTFVMLTVSPVAIITLLVLKANSLFLPDSQPEGAFQFTVCRNIQQHGYPPIFPHTTLLLLLRFDPIEDLTRCDLRIPEFAEKSSHIKGLSGADADMMMLA